MKTAFFNFVLKAPDKYKSGQKITTAQKTLKIAVPLAIIVFSAFLVQLAVRKLLLYPVTISDTAMKPTLEPGARAFFVYKNISAIRKGDIIATRYPGSTRINFCRIMATEGEKVEIRQKKLFINQKEIARPAGADTRIFPGPLSVRDNVPLTEVRPGFYYCLNDNSENTSDSRLWGPLPLADIEGKILPVKWLTPF